MNQPAEAPPVPRLDLRALEPPEPMRRALEAVEALSPGEAMDIVTDREPLLLYREPGRRGHRYVGGRRPDGFHITIRRIAGEDTP
jgi:uncharacterized protein (DUF2249 family)